MTRSIRTWAKSQSCEIVSKQDLMSPSRIHCVFALLSDESLAEAHSTLGLILSLHDWDAESGEREFRRAIELNPKDPTTLLRYGLHLVSLGHFGRAEAALRRALEIDPFSLMTNTHLGGVLMHRRQYEAAKDQLLKTVGMEPNFPEAHFYLMAVYGHTGKMEEAFAHIQQGITLSGGDVRMRCALISLKAATG